MLECRSWIARPFARPGGFDGIDFSGMSAAADSKPKSIVSCIVTAVTATIDEKLGDGMKQGIEK